MSVGDRHTLHGYSFIETLHGPFGPDQCVDCGAPTLSVVPTGRIGAGGEVEDAGAGSASRCSACGRAHHGAPAGAGTSVRAVPMPLDPAARIAWDERQRPPAPEVPAPEHTSRDPYPDGVPRALGATQLANLARGAGWTVEITYSCGPWLSARGAVAYQAHTLAVRGRLGAGAPVFHALYVRPGDKPGRGWTCDVVMLVVADREGIFPYASVTDLKDWILNSGLRPAEWYEAIKVKLAAQAVAAKAKAKERPKKARDHA